MADYISRDNVLRKFIEGDGHDDDRFTEGYNFAVQEYREKVKKIPAANVQPVRFARWIDLDNRILCSGCGAGYDDYDEVKQNTYIFCPNCGAKMIKDGEQNEP